MTFSFLSVGVGFSLFDMPALVELLLGFGPTILLFAVFTVSEHVNRRKRRETKKGLEEFNLEVQAQVSSDAVQARPGCVLVSVRDYGRMVHLHKVLEKTNLRRHDIVVMTVRPVTAGAAEYALSESQIFSNYEKELFTAVVTMAEKEGKPVDLLVVDDNTWPRQPAPVAAADANPFRAPTCKG